MMGGKGWSGHLLAFLTISIWSGTFIVSKILLETMTPLQVLTVRFFIAVLFLGILQPRFKKPGPVRTELLFLMIAAALVFYFVCENSALQRTATTNVSLIIATIPLLTGLLSSRRGKTRFFTVRRAGGSVLAYAGVALIVIQAGRIQGMAPAGDLLAMAAAVLFTGYSLLMEKAGHERTLIQQTRKVFSYGFLILLALTLIRREPLQWAELSWQTAAGLVFLGVVASSLAFLLWNQAIRGIGPVKTNQYIYLIPVMTALLSAVLLQEAITWTTVGGAVLILLGLYLAERPNSQTLQPAAGGQGEASEPARPQTK